jgi:hypothetical protein
MGLKNRKNHFISTSEEERTISSVLSDSSLTFTSLNTTDKYSKN